MRALSRVSLPCPSQQRPQSRAEQSHSQAAGNSNLQQHSSQNVHASVVGTNGWTTQKKQRMSLAGRQISSKTTKYMIKLAGTTYSMQSTLRQTRLDARTAHVVVRREHVNHLRPIYLTAPADRRSAGPRRERTWPLWSLLHNKNEAVSGLSYVSRSQQL